MASYRFADFISADLSVFNGEGYKKIQLDDQLLYGLGVTVNPIKELTIRAYADIKTARDTVSQQNVALFAGYKCHAFRIGAEYNMQLNHSNSDGRKLQGISVYGAGRINDRMELYARYDNGISSASDDWQYSNDGQTGILGLHIQANTLFSFSPNIRVSKSGSAKAAIYACVSGKVNF